MRNFLLPMKYVLIFGDYMDYILLFLMILTLLVVILGVTKIATSKKLDQKTNNKLMILRVALQASVIFIVAIAYLLKH